MRFIACLITFYVCLMYLSSFDKLLIMARVIILKESETVDFFPFWDIVWAIVFASILRVKLSDAPILKPAFKISIMMHFGFHYALCIVSLMSDSNNSLVVALSAVVGFLVIIVTRGIISTYFNRNPIEMD